MEELIERLKDLVESLSEGNVIHASVSHQQIRINGMRDLILAMEERMDTLRMRSLVHHRGVEAERVTKSLWEEA